MRGDEFVNGGFEAADALMHAASQLLRVSSANEPSTRLSQDA